MHGVWRRPHGQLPVLRHGRTGGRALLHRLRRRLRPGRQGDRCRGVGESEERRTVTVLFSRPVGLYLGRRASRPRDGQEDAHRALPDRFAAEVERFGGRVDKFIGDNVMAVFGAPVTHEDDAQRAVRAAFGMQAAMAELNGESPPEFGSTSRSASASTPARCSPAASATPTRCWATPSTWPRGCSRGAGGRQLVGERTQRLSARRSRSRARAADAEGQARARPGVGGARNP